MGFFSLCADKDSAMMITLYRIDGKGTAHYYTLHDRQGHLFSDFTFTTSWGKNVSLSREKSYRFDTLKERDEKIRRILQEKFKTGYRVLYSYFRPKEMEELQPDLKKHSVR